MAIKKIISKLCPLFMIPNNHPARDDLYTQNKLWRNTDIYDGMASEKVYPIINIGVKEGDMDVQNLCLVDFLADEYYVTMELQQVYKAEVYSNIVIMYTSNSIKADDSLVDIYLPHESNINEKDYCKMFNNLRLNRCELNAHFRLSEKGLDLNLSFVDKYDRFNHFVIKENKKSNDSFGLIAPVAASIKSPEFFPLVYLNEFNMVEQSGSYIDIKINSSSKPPKKFLPLCNFHRVFLIRYTFNTIIRNWNPNYYGLVEPVYVTDNTRTCWSNNCEYEIENADGYLTIKSVKSIYNQKEMNVTFYPALPDIAALKSEIDLDGNFSFDADSRIGILGGRYHIQKRGKNIIFTIHPTEGWQPMPGKKWMSTYLWTADITLLSDKVKMNGRWERL